MNARMQAGLRARKWLPGTALILCALLPRAVAAEPEATPAEPTLPMPRVAGLYSSWPNGAWQYRESLDPLFAQLGWVYDRFPNTDVDALAEALDDYDIFCPSSVYNYDNPQPLESHTEAWVRFLERGGTILASDANYGLQLNWIPRLGEGLELDIEPCTPDGVTGPRENRTVAPDDPLAPPADQLSWAHFKAHGPGWTVLTECPHGKAVCVKAQVGKGVLVATNLFSECGFPRTEYLERVWEAQRRRVLPSDIAVNVRPGETGVGLRRIAVRATRGDRPLRGTVRLGCRNAGGNGEQRLTADLPPDGSETTVPVRITGGVNDICLDIVADGEPVWHTAWREQLPDVLADADRLERDLGPALTACANLPPEHPITRKLGNVERRLRAARTEAVTVPDAPAGPDTRARWNALGEALHTLAEDSRVPVERSTIAARTVRETGPVPADRAFVVVRSDPLAKIHRDNAPEGPVTGPILLEAARGEAESLQVAIVPLGTTPLDVTVSLGAFKGPEEARVPAAAGELFRVRYVHVKGPSTGVADRRAWWPDPLLPVKGPFTIDGVSQGVWADIQVPRGIPAGLYRGELRIEGGGSRETIPVDLTVRDFEIPVAHSLQTLFILRASMIAERYFGTPDYRKTVPVDALLGMADVALKRRLGVQIFGYEGATEPVSAMGYVTEERDGNGWRFDFRDADRIWQHLHDRGARALFTGFMVGGGSLYAASKHPDYWPFLEAYLGALVPHLRGKGWLDEAVFYMVDEPWNEDAIEGNIRLAALMDRVAPGLRRLVTAPRDPRLAGTAHIWVPGGIPEALPDDPQQQALLEAWEPHPHEKWWYVCGAPNGYPNVIIDYPTIRSRTIPWLTWKYGKTGFVYWGIEWVGDPREMTPDGPTEAYSEADRVPCAGNGTLCYYGPDLTFYPSIRLNALRDGLEDYEYLVLLRNLAEAADPASPAALRARPLLSVTAEVFSAGPGGPGFACTEDPDVLRRARREVADAILALRNPPAN